MPWESPIEVIYVRWGDIHDPSPRVSPRKPAAAMTRRTLLKAGSFRAARGAKPWDSRPLGVRPRRTHPLVILIDLFAGRATRYWFRSEPDAPAGFAASLGDASALPGVLVSEHFAARESLRLDRTCL